MAKENVTEMILKKFTENLILKINSKYHIREVYNCKISSSGYSNSNNSSEPGQNRQKKIENSHYKCTVPIENTYGTENIAPCSTSA